MGTAGGDCGSHHRWHLLVPQLRPGPVRRLSTGRGRADTGTDPIGVVDPIVGRFASIGPDGYNDVYARSNRAVNADLLQLLLARTTLPSPTSQGRL